MRSLYDEPDPATPGPLAGLRVVDLTRARAGATCVRQLSEFGADVIAPRAPDGPGAFAPLGPDGANLQRNKHGAYAREVPAELGYDRGEIDRLAAAGVVRMEEESRR